MYAQQKTYGTLTNADAISLGVVPDELIKNRAAGTLKNSFNGEVNIHSSESTTGGDNKAFVIFFGGLSKEACITLATNDWGSGYSSGLIALQASGKSEAADKAGLDTIHIGDNGSGLKDNTAGQGQASNAVTRAYATPGGTGLSVPMSVTEAAATCSCSSGNTCSVTWKYY